MNIKKITKTKSGKYKIMVDDKIITTYDDVIIKNGILYKKKIDDELYNKINEENNYYEAYNRTVTYIMKHQRCTSEIVEYLDKFSISEIEKEKIIDHLKSIGLINDKNYAYSYVSDAINLSNDGPNKIRDYLLKLNIDENIINEAIDKIDSELIVQKVKKMVNKKQKNNRKYSLYQLRQKITYELVNLGYNIDLIQSIVDSVDFEEDDLLKKEYDKLKLKLSRKYNGKELTKMIKQKLYSKGFDINIINQVVDENNYE